MPDRRSHRGAGPDDARMFASAAVPRLRAAVAHLSWLLSHGYATNSSLKLVGDRFDLTARQRTAVLRSACADDVLAARLAREVPATALAGAMLDLDGYNVLTTVEAALGGGVLLLARDGCYRDMVSMHGSWRRVAETRPSLELVGRTLAALGVIACRWLFDKPVSNSGRLKAMCEKVGAEMAMAWEVELVPDPDPLLVDSGRIVVTADSGVLDGGPRWFPLTRHVVAAGASQAWIVDLRCDADRR